MYICCCCCGKLVLLIFPPDRFLCSGACPGDPGCKFDKDGFLGIGGNCCGGGIGNMFCFTGNCGPPY